MKSMEQVRVDREVDHVEYNYGRDAVGPWVVVQAIRGASVEVSEHGSLLDAVDALLRYPAEQLSIIPASVWADGCSFQLDNC